MNNYIGPGNSVTVVMPYARNAGQGVLVGSLFGVAQNTYSSGATGVMAIDGVFTRLAKATGAGEDWVAGDPLYWNDTDKNLVVASGTGNTANPVAYALETIGTGTATGGECVLAK